jgi:hypothetical protein
VQISVLAQKLNIYTLQSVTVSQNQIVVPTLDGQLLTVMPDGKSAVLVELLKANLGVPFGIDSDGKDLIVTVSGFLQEHYLVRVRPDGKYSAIADLSKLSGMYGAPFGVTVYQNAYWVTHSSDVVEDKSQLLRISPDGKIASIADLTQFGNPFGITVYQQNFVIAQSFGALVRVTAQGEAKAIVNLKDLEFGIPFDVAVWRDRLVATTNAGQIVQVDATGKVGSIVDLVKQKYGIPSGIAVRGEDLIVTTNNGFLLQITV